MLMSVPVLQEALQMVVNVLKTCEPLAGLKPGELRELARLGEAHTFSQGDGVAIAGEPDNRMFVICSGACCVTQVM